MKKDQDKTKEQLITELKEMRQRVVELEASEVEHKQAETIPSAAEENYLRMFELFPIGITVLDMKGVILYWNPAVYNGGGYAEDEIVGKHFSKIASVRLKDIPKFIRVFNSLVRGKIPKPFEAIYQRKDGTTGWTELHIGLTKVGGKRRILVIKHDITERRQAEEALQESERHYRLLAENAKDAIWTVDMNMRPTYMSPSITYLLGYTVEEAMAKPMEAVYTPASFEIAMKVLAEELAIENMEQKDLFRSRTVELELNRKDGSIVSVEGNFSFIRGPDGRPIGILAIARDITERKKAEEALRQSEEKLEAILENTNDIIFQLSPLGTIQYVSPRAIELYGYKTEDLIGRHLRTTTPARELPKALKVLKSVLSGKVISNFEINQLDANGRIVPVEINATPVRKDGKIIALQGVMRDITQRKEAQDRIKRAAEEWRSTFDSITDLVFINDTNFRLVRVNKAFADALNMKPGELVGKTCYQVVHGRNEPVLSCPHMKTLETKEPATADFFEPHLGIHLEMATSPIFDGKGKAVASVHVARDITERKQAEGELLDYQKELRSLASELSLAEERERRRIATEVHDRVGQNLAICRMKLGSLVKAVRSTRLAKPLSEIQTLIKGLIDEVRSLTFELSSPLLYELGLEAAVERLTEQMGKEHSVKFNFKDDGQPKPLDNDIRVLLFQAVRELLINITKHAQARHARVCMERHDSNLRITVVDDGVGFDTSRISPGSKRTKGFGLFSIRERLHQIGGHIGIESEQGQGTQVTLTAPLKQT